jgi:hypothetical protein
MLNFDWLAHISVESAKWVFLGLFIFLGALILFIPNKFIYQGLKKIEWYHNLKIWSIGLLGFIFVVYYFFD